MLVKMLVVRPQPTMARLSVGPQAQCAPNLQMADREWPQPTNAGGAQAELAVDP